MALPPKPTVDPALGEPFQLYNVDLAKDVPGAPPETRATPSRFMDAYNQTWMASVRDWTINDKAYREGAPAPAGWKPSIPEGYGEFGEAFLDARNPAELNSIKMQIDRNLDGQRRRARDGFVDTLGMDLLVGITGDPTNLVGMEVKGATYLARGIKAGIEQAGITAATEGVRLSLSPTANLEEAAVAVAGAGIIGAPVGAVLGTRTGRAAVPRDRVARGTPSARAAEPLSSPLRGPRRVTSFFGPRKAPKTAKGLGSTVHEGVDFAGYEGEPIYAEADGKVSGKTVTTGGYGKHLQVTYGGGRVVGTYSHLSQFAVETGQEVKKGDIIGYVGSTGKSTGPHLHVEHIVDGKKVDPLAPGGIDQHLADTTNPHAGYAYSALGGVEVPHQVDFNGRGVNVTIGPKDGAPASYTRLKEGNEIANDVADEVFHGDQALQPTEVSNTPYTDANSDLVRSYAPNDPNAVDGWVTRRIPRTDNEPVTGMPGAAPARTTATMGDAPARKSSIELPESAQRMNSDQLTKFAQRLEAIVEDLRVQYRKGVRSVPVTEERGKGRTKATIVDGERIPGRQQMTDITGRAKYLLAMAEEARTQADWLDGEWGLDPQTGKADQWLPAKRQADDVPDEMDPELALLQKMDREKRSDDLSWRVDETPYDARATTSDSNPYLEGIHLDVDRLAADFPNKPWTTPTMDGVEPLPADAFTDVADYVQWTMYHELYHSTVPKLAKETVAEYENRINKLATEHLAREQIPWKPSQNRLQHLAIAPSPLGQAERLLKDWPQLGFFKSIMDLSGDGALFTARNRMGAPTTPGGSVFQRSAMWFRHQYAVNRALKQGYANAVGRSIEGLDPVSAAGVKLGTFVRQKLSRGYRPLDFAEDVMAHMAGLTDREFDEHVIKASGEVTAVFEKFAKAAQEVGLHPTTRTLKAKADRLDNLIKETEQRLTDLREELGGRASETPPAGTTPPAGEATPPDTWTPLAGRTAPTGRSVDDIKADIEALPRDASRFTLGEKTPDQLRWSALHDELRAARGETFDTPMGGRRSPETLQRLIDIHEEQVARYREQAIQARADAEAPLMPVNEERYVPKHYDQSALEQNEAAALEALEAAYTREGSADPAASAKAAYDLLTREPSGELGQMGSPMYLKMRKIPWTTAEAFPFMVKDLSTISAIYNRRMSTQIEMARRFGDGFGLDELDRLEAEMIEHGVPEDTRVQALQLWQDQRDHINGQFHGRDPLSLRNRGVRALKNYGALTFFGNIIKSQMTDLARINMIHGFGTRFWLGDKEAPAGLAQGLFGLLAGHFPLGLESFGKQAGEAMELGHAMVNARMMEADSALMVTRQTWLENVLAKAQLPYFVANLMIPFTVLAKETGAILAGHNIVNQSRLVAAAVRAGELPDDKMIQRLAALGIDRIDAMIIADMPTEMTPGGLHLVNLDAWDAAHPRGARAAEVMRGAVNSEVRRSVITPGPLDSPAAAYGVIHSKEGAMTARARVEEARDLVGKRKAEFGEVWHLDDKNPDRVEALTNLQAAYGELEQARRAVGQEGRIEIPELQLPFQIKSFMFAAGGKLLHGLVSRPEQNRVMGMIGMFATSAAVTYWKYGGYVEDWKQFMVDSLDQMGIGGWMSDLGKTVDAATNLGIFHDYDEEGHYYGDEVGAVGGASVGSLFKTIEAAVNNDIPAEDRRRQLLGAIPMVNMIWLKGIIKAMKSGLDDAGVTSPGMGSDAPDIRPMQPQELSPDLRGRDFITGDDPRFSKYQPLPKTQVVKAFDPPNPPAPYASDIAKDKRVRRQQRIKARMEALAGYDPVQIEQMQMDGSSVH